MPLHDLLTYTDTTEILAEQLRQAILVSVVHRVDWSPEDVCANTRKMQSQR